MSGKPGTTRLYIGGLKAEIRPAELQEEFSRFGKVASAWVARQPPGFGFIEMEDKRDAEDAIKDLHDRDWKGCRLRVELSKPKDPNHSRKSELKCYHCNRVGHLARDCLDKPRDDRDRRRSRTPPRRDRSRERSPRRSPPRRERSRSRGRDERRDRGGRSRSRERSPRRDRSPRREESKVNSGST